jgi:hypothetical protein
MKKAIPFVFSLLITVLSVQGQNYSIGLFGGMNLSNVNGTYNSDGYYTKTTTLVTKQFGVILSYPVSDKLSLFSDPGYYEKGFNYEPVETYTGGGTVKGRSKFKSVDVPLTLKFGMFKNQIFYIRTGVYLSFLLSAKNNDTIYYDMPDMETKITEDDIMDKMNKTTLGFIAGAGFDIPVWENFSVLIDVSYRLDLSDAMKNKQTSFWPHKTSETYFVNTNEVRNRNLTVSAGLTYRF